MRKAKRLLSIALAALVIIAAVPDMLAATVPGPRIMLNNVLLSSGTDVVSSSGTLMTPAKELSGALSGDFYYDSSLMVGTIKKGETEIAFRLDDSIAKFNGKFVQAPAAMSIANMRFMIPAQFVAEKLGAKCFFSSSRNMLMIFMPVNGQIVYKVMAGDTLWNLSVLFGTSISSLKSMNGLSGDTIYVGQSLVVKNVSPTSAVFPANTTRSATLFSGPGFNYSASGYLQAAVGVSVTGKTGDWYKVVTPKGNGYVHYSVLAVKQDISDIAPDSRFFDGRIEVDTSKDSITYSSYSVQKGDTLWAVAERFGVPDYELAAANNMTMSSTLYIGQVLKIPVHNVPVKTTAGSMYGEVLDWFKEAQYLFPIGKTGRFYDPATGNSFMAKRTMGANHSDTETLSLQDTAAMKKIFGGSWNWGRKSMILEVDGRRFAVSVAGMPHAGVDGVPYLQNVDGRSDNWGYGPNYDRLAGNGMDGHFDVYFLNCLKHKDNAYDPLHQYGVMLSGGLR